jgi:DNA-binding response OmpR family regulator
MNGRILLVDDEDSLRLATQARLQSKGYDVMTAADGEEALELLQTEEFDVALLDINMPRMNGLQVLDYITQSRPKTDVVMLTGFADFSTALECLKKGARDYLVKPVDTSELISRVNAILRARNSEQALSHYQHEHAALHFCGVLAPLNTMVSFLESVSSREGGTLSPEAQAMLRYAQTLGTQAIARVKDAADLSSLQKPLVPQNGHIKELEAVVLEAVERYAALAKVRGISFSREVLQRIPAVGVDTAMVEGALNSVFDHAFRYAETGGVSFSLSTQPLEGDASRGQALLFSVSFKSPELDVIGTSHLGKNPERLMKRASEFETTVLALTAWRQLFEAAGGRLWIDRGEDTTQYLNVTVPIKNP